MAKRFLYRFQTYKFENGSDRLDDVATGHAIDAVPAVYWSDSTPWLEACSYLASRASAKTAEGRSIESVQAESWHLRDYATFLEERSLSWTRFPLSEAERPTKLYRGFLVRARREQRLSSSTASMRIAAITRFYDWAWNLGLLEPGAVPFTRKNALISHYDRVGRARTTQVLTSDLAIPNRSHHSEGVEDGLFPISTTQRDSLLELAREFSHPEFVLMLLLGFFTGMRIGTIISLNQKALRNTFPSRDIAGWESFEVGPKVGIATKGSVQYFPSIPGWLLTMLREHCQTLRSLERRRKAKPEDKGLVFLKRNGGRYTNTTCREELTKLRRLASVQNLGLNKFKFHCTRATFGTLIVEAYLKRTKLPSTVIMAKLMSLMGHKTIQSSLRYLKFVEQSEQDHILNEEYATYLLGSEQTHGV